MTLDALFRPALLQRLAPWYLILVGGGALAFVFVNQYGLGYQPCYLCLWQRGPYYAALALGLVALVVKNRRGRAALLALGGLGFLAGAGIAFYHIGVEQHWWASTCSGASGAALSIDQLKAQIMAAPVTRCDEVNWTLFGLSMTTYNFLGSIPLGLVTLVGAWRLGRAG